MNADAKQAASYDVKLLAKVNDADAGTVQPDKAGGKKVLVKVKLESNLKLDTLAIYHIHDGNATPTQVTHTAISEGADSFAVFEISEFSYFVFFAEEKTTPIPSIPDKPDGGSSGGSSTAWRPEIV